MKKLSLIVFGVVLVLIVGAVGFKENLLLLGDKTDTDVVIEADITTSAADPNITYNTTSDKWTFTNDGTTFADIGSGGGGTGTNLLAKQDGNHNFEDTTITTDWTESSGSTLAKDVSTNGFDDASASWDPVTSQTLTSIDVVVEKGLEGRDCLAHGQYKTDAATGEYIVRVELDAGTAITLDLELSDTLGVWTTFNLPFMCPTADSVHIEFANPVTGNPAALLLLDDIHVGSDIREVEISQATVFGTFAYNPDTNCLFAGNGSLNTWTSYLADADCVDTTATGNIVAPDTVIPALKIPSLPPGRIVITAQSRFTGAAATRCMWGFHDGTTRADGRTRADTGAGDYEGVTLIGEFNYSTTQTNLQIEIQQNRLLGAGDCQIDGRDTVGIESYVKFIVMHYPNDVETAIQKPETQKWKINAGIGGAQVDLGTSNIAAYASPPNGSLNLVNNGGSPVGISCSSTNESNVGDLTCSAGLEQIGIVVDIPFLGDYEICGAFSHRISGDGGSNVQATFQWMHTPNNAQTITTEGQGRIYSVLQPPTTNLEVTYPIYFCGEFFNLSPGKKTFRLMREQIIAATITAHQIDIGRTPSLGDQDANITMRPLNQQFPSAVLLTDKVNKWQTQTSADGAATVVHTWDSLVVGKIYRLSAQGRIQVQSGNGVATITISIDHDSSLIAFGVASGIRNTTITGSPSQTPTLYTDVIFQATATTITATFVPTTSIGMLMREVRSTIEELNTYDVESTIYGP